MWQDFPFACAMYPEALLRDEITAETADNVTRLMPHPSLALWCGNNECLQGWSEWGRRDLVGERPWGDGFTVTSSRDRRRPRPRPAVRRRVTDRARRGDPAEHRNRGTVHLWDVWNRLDYEHYRIPPAQVRRRVRLPGATSRGDDRGAVTSRRSSSTAPRYSTTRRRRTGTANCGAPSSTTSAKSPTSTTGCTLAQVNQARAIDVGIGHFRACTSAAPEWCGGSSMTAGRRSAGRDRPRRTAQAELVRAAPGVRRPPGCPPPSDGARARPRARQRRRRGVGGGGQGTPRHGRVSLTRSALEATVAAGAPPSLGPPAGLRGGDGLSWPRPEGGGARSTGVDRPARASTVDVAVDAARRRSARHDGATLVRDLCLFADRIDPGGGRRATRHATPRRATHSP